MFSKMIYQEAFELDFQLKNIFAAAKMEAGEFAPQISNVKVIDLIESVLKTYEHKAKEKEITLVLNYKAESHNSFKTDPDKLKLVVSNLVNNAIRFSKEGNKIIIDVANNNETLTINVRDFGIGIDKESIDTIFDRFKRINNAINSENQGLGLGLTVTKGVLELINSSITVAPKKDGAEFIVKIKEDNSIEELSEFSTDGNELFFDAESEIF
jgi:signal transduction histidine kinase